MKENVIHFILINIFHKKRKQITILMVIMIIFSFSFDALDVQSPPSKQCSVSFKDKLHFPSPQDNDLELQ